MGRITRAILLSRIALWMGEWTSRLKAKQFSLLFD